MNPTLNFIFLAVILTIVLVALDLILLRLQTRQYEEGEPLLAQLQKALRRRAVQIRELTLGLLPKPQLPNLPVPLPPASRVDEQVTAAQVTIEPIPAESGSGVSEALPNQVLAQRAEPQSALVQISAPENGTQNSGRMVRVQVSAEIPEGTVVHITIQTVNGDGQATLRHETLQGENLALNSAHPEIIQTHLAITTPKAAKQPKSDSPSPGAIAALVPFLAIRLFFENLLEKIRSAGNKDSANWGRILFLLSILVYLLVVGIGIDRFPIYFFTDEAVHMNLASEFVERSFTGSDGSLFPTYFSLGPSFALNGVSVYLQVLPFILFGKSVAVIRLVSALITLLGAILVGLLLKQVFKVKAYWLGILLLITSPAWFLHARTAFEYMEVAAFFAAMLYFYNRYRQGEDKYLYATVFAAALTFYTHGLGQVLVGLTALFFFFSDLRYHFQPERRRTLLNALGLAVLFALPYLRYNLSYPEAVAAQIKQRGSYWMDGNFTFQDRLVTLLKEYARGINPLFWFTPNSIDIDRHRMLGYGNLLLGMLPFAVVGIVRACVKIRQPEYRSVLIALLIAPIPATIVAIGTPRLLWMIVPWVVLIALGFDWVIDWLAERTKVLRFEYINLVLFIVLASTSFYLLRDALVNGPLWFKDYGLYGMQYGAKQIFEETVVPALEKDPQLNFIISPSWANGTDQFVAFFVPEKLRNRVRFGTPNDLINDPKQLTPNTVFILSADEYGNFSKDETIKAINVRQTIPYPDGRPGFYLVTLEYPDNLAQIIADEHEARRKPIEGTVQINGQVIRIIHSPIGGGNIQDTFDDKPDTLTRVTEANPYIFDLYPETPLDTNSLVVQTGSLSNFTVTVSLYAPGATEPVTYSQTFKDLPPDPLVTLIFDQGPAKSARIYLEIKDNTSGETSQIHVRTVQFK